jgi:hypothetical protein
VSINNPDRCNALAKPAEYATDETQRSSTGGKAIFRVSPLDSVSKCENLRSLFPNEYTSFVPSCS